MNSDGTLQTLAQELKACGIELPAGRARLDSYGDSPEQERELLELIKSGIKRATASLVWAYEEEGIEIRHPEDIEIIVNSKGRPELVTRVKSVELVPFSKVTEDHAALEGEGDKSLKYWRDSHWQFFSRECTRIGRSPSTDMPVVCTAFEVLNVVTPNAAT